MQLAYSLLVAVGLFLALCWSIIEAVGGGGGVFDPKYCGEFRANNDRIQLVPGKRGEKGEAGFVDYEWIQSEINERIDIAMILKMDAKMRKLEASFAKKLEDAMKNKDAKSRKQEKRIAELEKIVADLNVDDCPRNEPSATFPSPVQDGTWNSWSRWSRCSATCGGTTIRTRTCAGVCTGSGTDARQCSTEKCEPDDADVKCQVIHGNKCFKIIDAGDNANRPYHEKLCSKQGGHLANVYDEGHFHKLNDYIIQRALETRNLWTGLNYENDRLKFHDGTGANYARWKTDNEPTAHSTWTAIVFHSYDDKRMKAYFGENWFMQSGYRNVAPDTKYRYSICEFGVGG